MQNPMSRQAWVGIGLGVSFSVAMTFTAWFPTAVGPVAWGLTVALAVWWYVEHRSAVTAGTKPTWDSLEQRFREALAEERRRGELVRADVMPSDKGPVWWIHGWSESSRRDLQVLYRLAGRRLAVGTFVDSLSPRTRGATDDLDRWLYFLGETGESEKRFITTHYEKGVETERHPPSIERLNESSVRACIRAATLEL